MILLLEDQVGGVVRQRPAAPQTTPSARHSASGGACRSCRPERTCPGHAACRCSAPEAAAAPTPAEWSAGDCTPGQGQQSPLAAEAKSVAKARPSLAVELRRIEQGAWICFEDEAGQTLRPPRARTWGRRSWPHSPTSHSSLRPAWMGWSMIRGRTPVVDHRRAGSGTFVVAPWSPHRPNATHWVADEDGRADRAVHILMLQLLLPADHLRS